MTAVPPLVHVVTLNWNRCADTLELLQSCQGLTYPRVKLVMVDNGSSDDSIARVAAAFPAVTIIANGRNLGFAGGVNAGIRHALADGADLIFLVNNDTTLAPDCLDRLVAAMQAERADLAAPAIYYASQPQRLWELGRRLRPLVLEFAHMPAPADGQALAVDAITGCGMLISRRCFEAIGLFDERFFMYYEDMDYCLRARAGGYRALAVPGAAMWHKISASSGGSDSPNERYQMARSSVIFFRKHARGWRWLAVAPYRTASAARTILRLLRKGSGKAASAYLRGLRHGLTLPIDAKTTANPPFRP